jgi:hypothetical protein
MKRTEEKVATPGREKPNKPDPTASQPSRKVDPGPNQKDPGTKKNIPPHEWQSEKPIENQSKEGQHHTDRTDVEDETTF